MRHLLVFALCGTASAQLSWQQVPTNGSPSPRFGHAMAYDSVRQKVVLFGGGDSGSLLADTWLFDGAAWSQVSTPVHPPAIARGAMVFDSARGRCVLFGGSTANGVTNDTWEFDGLGWSRAAATNAPPARGRHAMTFDVPRSRVVMFGGDLNDSAFGDTWEFDGLAWTQVNPSPPGRWQHGMAYDVARNESLMFGGDANNGQFSDTWRYDAAGWHFANVSGPPHQEDHAMTSFGGCAGVVLFGALLPETWTWNGTSWSQISGASPSPRRANRMVYDTVNNRVVMFGGSDAAGNHLNDTWILTPTTICAGWSSFGNGCDGSNGATPALAGVPSSKPRLGSWATIEASGLPAAVTIPVFFYGRSNTLNAGPPSYPLPIDLGPLGWPGCEQLVSAETYFFAITTTGQAQHSIFVPLNTALVGQHYYAQALVLYTPDGVAVTNGVEGTIGY